MNKFTQGDRLLFCKANSREKFSFEESKRTSVNEPFKRIFIKLHPR